MEFEEFMCPPSPVPGQPAPQSLESDFLSPENVFAASNDLFENWDESGSCMAMSVMALNYYLDDVPSSRGLFIDLEEHEFSASVLYLIMPTAGQAIFQTIPNLYALIDQLFGGSDLDEIIDAYNELQLGYPAVIASYFLQGGSKVGHAVLAYKASYLQQENEYRIYVYDSNYPGTNGDDTCYFSIKDLNTSPRIIYNKMVLDEIAGSLPLYVVIDDVFNFAESAISHLLQ